MKINRWEESEEEVSSIGNKQTALNRKHCIKSVCISQALIHSHAPSYCGAFEQIIKISDVYVFTYIIHSSGDIIQSKEKLFTHKKQNKYSKRKEKHNQNQNNAVRLIKSKRMPAKNE